MAFFINQAFAFPKNDISGFIGFYNGKVGVTDNYQVDEMVKDELVF
ncbi:MAG: hypothetical protein KAT54_08655 [Candidatus Marinimicrobia bacterium]|nr:hypothetical protein [Candidatus Neomarinimicrobiota bacterium]